METWVVVLIVVAVIALIIWGVASMVSVLNEYERGVVFRLGKLPINVSLQAFDYVEKPVFGADWELRAQVQFLFPK